MFPLKIGKKKKLYYDYYFSIKKENLLTRRVEARLAEKKVTTLSDPVQAVLDQLQDLAVFQIHQKPIAEQHIESRIQNRN